VHKSALCATRERGPHRAGFVINIQKRLEFIGHREGIRVHHPAYDAHMVLHIDAGGLAEGRTRCEISRSVLCALDGKSEGGTIDGAFHADASTRERTYDLVRHNDGGLHETMWP